MRELGKRTIQISIALGAIVGLIGCGEETSEVEAPSHDLALSALNGLSTINGLSSLNGLSAMNGLSALNGLSSLNGLSAMNGLSSLNGLSSMNGLMTTSAGRKTVSYIAKCALAASDSLVKQDQNGANYTFPGGIGLCPAWKTGGINNSGACEELISACMMAHVNTAGVHVPLWLDAQNPAVGWGIDTVNFPFQEGTFFGNIIETGPLNSTGKPTVTAPAAFYCDGAGFAGGNSGVVAGRLGAGQAGAPYVNPFGNGTLCKNAPANTPYYSKGVGGQTDPDGYVKLEKPAGTPWNNAITVWRNNSYNPIFDTSYQYTLSANITGGNMVLDSGTSPIQQWNASAGLVTSVFNMAPSGSNWSISPLAAPTKCLDAGSGANGTGIVLAACNGSAQQAFNITPDVATGNFFVKASSTGRCMNVRNGATSAGTVMEVYDCNTTYTSEKFAIQATVYAGDQSGSVVNTTATGSTPCASFCAAPTVMAAQSDSITNISTSAVCYESTYNIGGFNCGNMSGRTFTVNGQTITCGGNSTPPAKVNGGYCFQLSAGGTTSAYFGTW